MASAVETATARPEKRADTRVRDLRVFKTMHEAESLWRSLERSPDFMMTGFQKFGLLDAWQTHAGMAMGTEPLIAVALDHAGMPLALFPLFVRTDGGVRVARFFGGKHCTLNMPIWHRGFAAAADRFDMLAISRALASHADVLAFNQQPFSWRGNRNPMTQLAHQASINVCPVLDTRELTAQERSPTYPVRRTIVSKSRKLAAMPGYRYLLARSEKDIARALDMFFAVKPKRMNEQRLPNVFAEPGVEDFIRTISLPSPTAPKPMIDIHMLECDAEVIAVFAGVADGTRYSMIFNTYTMSDAAKLSPGLVLLSDIIDHYMAEGYTEFDLGTGADFYKRRFCKDDEPLFDQFIALNARGTLTALAMSSANRAKRAIKQNPALAKIAQTVRYALPR